MTTRSEPSLAEQRQSIRRQLQAQRQVVGELIAPANGGLGHYPRSMTMRLLIQQPTMLARLVTLIAGVRFARSTSAILVLIQLLLPAIAVAAQKLLAAPQPKNDRMLIDISSASSRPSVR